MTCQVAGSTNELLSPCTISLTNNDSSTKTTTINVSSDQLHSKPVPHHGLIDQKCRRLILMHDQ